jgi:hypothetical protein
MCGCFDNYVGVLVMCGCFDNYVGVLVMCILVFAVFCIVRTVFFYCFTYVRVYIYSYLFCLD